VSTPKPAPKRRAPRTSTTTPAAAKAPQARTRRVRTRPTQPAPPNPPSDTPPVLTWPMQLELVRETSRLALRQCSSTEAVLLGEFLLSVGVRVLEVVDDRSVMVIEKDTLLDQLIARIHQRAEDQALDVADVIETLLLKLDAHVVMALN